MTRKDIIKVLKEFNDYRRGTGKFEDESFTIRDLIYSPEEIGEAIDQAIKLLEVESDNESTKVKIDEDRICVLSDSKIIDLNNYLRYPYLMNKTEKDEMDKYVSGREVRFFKDSMINEVSQFIKNNNLIEFDEELREDSIKVRGKLLIIKPKVKEDE